MYHRHPKVTGGGDFDFLSAAPGLDDWFFFGTVFGMVVFYLTAGSPFGWWRGGLSF